MEVNMEEKLNKLLEKVNTYSKGQDVNVIVRAYNFANEKHKNQQRKSGEPYIMHPVNVALILADLELDINAIAAGLLHDVVEDTEVTNEKMVELFGEDIASLVDGVTKLGKLDYKSKEENQTENLRKMFMAMAKDVRVILIKLSDRLHNMRTLKYMKPAKAMEKSKESMEIFAPIAGRLGIFKIKWELEEIALRYLEPDFYFTMQRRVRERLKERDDYISGIVKKLRKAIKEEMDIDCEIYGREKNLYSIYRKMVFKKRAFEEIYDFIAVRVIVKTIKECYGVLGLIHSMWKPMPNRFKDYIAMPKDNMYQSIHTTIFGPDGEPIEVQIRTEDMHKTAEYGIAAHWKYKEGRIDPKESETDKKLSWLRQMMDWQKEVTDPKEFMESLKMDLFSNQVFVYTPAGDIIQLPNGSTPIDLAYKIHTNVGNSMVGAKINGKIVPIDTELKNSEIVEILTSSSSKGPSRDWINIVKSSHARAKIRQWFKKEKREENIEKGIELLERDVIRQNYDSKDFLCKKALLEVCEYLNQKTIEDLYAAIGYGGLTLNQVIGKLRDIYKRDFAEKIREEKIRLLKENQNITDDEKLKKKQKASKDKQLVIVKDMDNILTRLAKCCNPIPGDEIMGYITKGRGVTVHRKDCKNVQRDIKGREEQVIDVKWNDRKDIKDFDVELEIRAFDRQGFFFDISSIFEDEKCDLKSINGRKKENIAIMDITFKVKDNYQLKKITKKLKKIRDVKEVYRISR